MSKFDVKLLSKDVETFVKSCPKDFPNLEKFYPLLYEFFQDMSGLSNVNPTDEETFYDGVEGNKYVRDGYNAFAMRSSKLLLDLAYSGDREVILGAKKYNPEFYEKLRDLFTEAHTKDNYDKQETFWLLHDSMYDLLYLPEHNWSSRKYNYNEHLLGKIKEYKEVQKQSSALIAGEGHGSSLQELLNKLCNICPDKFVGLEMFVPEFYDILIEVKNANSKDVCESKELVVKFSKLLLDVSYTGPMEHVIPNINGNNEYYATLKELYSTIDKVEVTPATLVTIEDFVKTLLNDFMNSDEVIENIYQAKDVTYWGPTWEDEWYETQELEEDVQLTYGVEDLGLYFEYLDLVGTNKKSNRMDLF